MRAYTGRTVLQGGALASGSPKKTLSKTASGTAAQKFTGSGAAIKTLSKTASGTAVQTFTGSGAAIKTLSAFASGSATSADPGLITGSGAAVKTLSVFASGSATMTPKVVSAPMVIIGGWKEDEPAILTERMLKAQETPEPVFPSLPEVIPGRRIAWAKIHKAKLSEKRTSISDKPAIEPATRRRRRAQDTLIKMLMAGAA